MSGGFHSEDELRKMEQHPSVQAIRIGRTKPYDCSYPVMESKPRIAAWMPLPETYRESEE